MKRVLIYLITVSVIISYETVFEKSVAQALKNYYNGYNPMNQLRPEINKVDFYRQTGFDFGWMLLEPINIAKTREAEPKLAKRFSPGQKALYFWWYLDAQVTNGGFLQFYYNEYGIYIPPIIEGLEHIGDSEMAGLVRKANNVYLENKHIIDEARDAGVYGSDLVNRLEALNKFNAQYYKINDQTMSCIEQYARKNPHEFCVDENGQPFEQSFTGKCARNYENGKIKEELEVVDGMLHGAFKSFYETGQIKLAHNYIKGKQVGEQKEWFENGNLKEVLTIDPETQKQKLETYHENGEMASLTNKNAQGDNEGQTQTWYKNGQLKEQMTYDENAELAGEWLQFWEDGKKKLEAEVKDGETYLHNYWTREGQQVLKNGTGIYGSGEEPDDPEKVSDFWEESEYVDYKRHGFSKLYINGVLRLSQEYKNGVLHGLTEDYDATGKVVEQKVFVNGELQATK